MHYITLRAHLLGELGRAPLGRAHLGAAHAGVGYLSVVRSEKREERERETRRTLATTAVVSSVLQTTVECNALYLLHHSNIVVTTEECP